MEAACCSIRPAAPIRLTRLNARGPSPRSPGGTAPTRCAASSPSCPTPCVAEDVDAGRCEAGQTAAKLRRDAGASVEAVSAFLDHSSLAVTTVYLRRLEGETDKIWPDVAVAIGV